VIFCGFIQRKGSEEEEDNISIIHGLLLVSFDFVSIFFLAVECLQVGKNPSAPSTFWSFFILFLFFLFVPAWLHPTRRALSLSHSLSPPLVEAPGYLALSLSRSSRRQGELCSSLKIMATSRNMHYFSSSSSSTTTFS
jgi:hypothetical protein